VGDPKYLHISDQELLDQFYRDGDNKWLGLLLERYTLLLYGVCMKYFKDEEAAKDGVQQIFLKAISELQKQYKVDFFKSWLYRIAFSYCMMVFKDRRRMIIQLLDNDLEMKAGTEEIMTETEKEGQISSIFEALTELNEQQRVCVRMFYLDRKTYQEISNLTEYPVAQVKSNIQNGKRNLRLILERKISKQ